MLELDVVRKHYIGPGDVVRAVDDVSLSVADGEFAAIFGPSGSGKTTLLLLAAGLLTPDHGTVSYRGQVLSSLDKDKALRLRREEFGFIFQNFNLMPGLSAQDNVIIKRLYAGISYREAAAESRSLLDLVGLTGRAAHRPFELSGGEKQRVAIARALAGRPSLIFADEPTGNLDTKRGGEVLSLLSDIHREHRAAVILVTHDSRASDHAERTLEMQDGNLFDHTSTKKPTSILAMRQGQ